MNCAPQGSVTLTFNRGTQPTESICFQHQVPRPYWLMYTTHLCTETLLYCRIPGYFTTSVSKPGYFKISISF